MSLKRWGSSSLLSLLTHTPPTVISAFLVFPAMFSSTLSSAGLGWETGGGRGGESEGPLCLLIVLISPLDSSLIALLCLQGHHYSDQAQLCFSLLFMNIILPNNCFEVFSRQRSHLITYRYVNAWALLAFAGHNIFHMQGFSSLHQIWNPKHFWSVFFFFFPSVYSLKSSAAAFEVLAARGSESTESVCIQVRLWEGPKPSSLCPPGEETLVFCSCLSVVSVWKHFVFCHLAQRPSDFTGEKWKPPCFHCANCI